MRLQVDVDYHGPHQMAIEWTWENTDGVNVFMPADAPPLTLKVTVTQLDDCDET